MTKLTTKLVCSFLIILSSLMWGQYAILADTQPEEVYSIKPILGKEQNPEVSNYFSMKSDKDIKSEFSVEITNRSDEPLSLTVESLNAFSGPYGLIQYAKGNSINNSFINSEVRAFTNYVDITDIITVKPNSVSTFSFDVNIPKSDGTILGALSFRTVTEGEQSSDSNVSIQINNEINNIIAFQVDFGDNLLSAIEFDDASLFYSDFDTHIVLPVRVISNSLIEGAVLTYTVYNIKDEKVFDNEGNPQIIHLVPNADFDIHIPWNSNSLSSNEQYTITGALTVPSEDNETIGFSKKFKYEKTKGVSEGTQMQGGVIMETTNTLFDSSWGIAGTVLVLAIIFAILIKYVSAKILIYSNRKYNEMKSKVESRVKSNDDEFSEFNDKEELAFKFIANAKLILDADLNDITNERDEIDLELFQNEEMFIESTNFVNDHSELELDANTFPKILDTVEMNTHSLDSVDTMNEEVEHLCVSAIYEKVDEEEYQLRYIVIPQ